MILSIENLGTPADLASCALALEEAERASTSLRLDFSPLDAAGSDKRRLDVVAVALLADLLVGRFATIPIEVNYATESGALLQLRRGGLHFAFAQRATGLTTFVNGRPDDINRWSREWLPTGRDTLFEEAVADGVAERMYLYANTHGRGEGFFRKYEKGAAMPWVGELIPTPRDPTQRWVRNGFVLSAIEAMVEVLENFPTRAFNRLRRLDDDWLTPHPTRNRSFFLASLTKGGTGSWDRLYFLAVDNGYGIGRTLRWRHSEVADSTADLIKTILQRQLLARGIPGHNGRGLWFLHDVARIGGGEVSVITEDDLDPRRRAVEVSFESPAAEKGETTWREPRHWDIPLRGTVIKVELRVPHASGTMQRLYVEQYRQLLHAGAHPSD